MRIIKRPNFIYHVSACNNCFYNSAIYSEEIIQPICTKTYTHIEYPDEIMHNCPLEKDI